MFSAGGRQPSAHVTELSVSHKRGAVQWPGEGGNLVTVTDFGGHMADIQIAEHSLIIGVGGEERVEIRLLSGIWISQFLQFLTSQLKRFNHLI
jgi:hypothetical protein